MGIDNNVNIGTYIPPTKTQAGKAPSAAQAAQQAATQVAQVAKQAASAAIGHDSLNVSNKCQNYDKYSQSSSAIISTLTVDQKKEVNGIVNKYGKEIVYSELKDLVKNNPKYSANFDKFISNLKPEEAHRFKAELEKGNAFPSNSVALICQGYTPKGGEC